MVIGKSNCVAFITRKGNIEGAMLFSCQPIGMNIFIRASDGSNNSKNIKRNKLSEQVPKFNKNIKD